MRFKRHVDASGVHPRMWQILMWLDQLHLAATEEELWVTSLRRSFRKGVDTRHAIGNVSLTAMDPRRHPGDFVQAADIRRWALDELDDEPGLEHGASAAEFCRNIQHAYGSQIGVLLEPEWLSRRQLRQRFPDLSEKAARKAVGPHIHLQLKKPIRWTTLV